MADGLLTKTRPALDVREQESSSSWLAGTRRLVVVVVVLAIVAVVLVPIFVTIRMSLWSGSLGAAGQFTWSHYADLFTDSSILPLLGSTAVFTLASAAGGTVLGGLLAWITTSTNVPFRRFTSLLPMLPLLIPPFMKDAGWIVLYRPQAGLVNAELRNWFGVSGSPFNINSMPGMIAIAIGAGSSIAYAVLVAPMASMNHTLDEASRIAGAGPVRTTFKITIPILTPAVVSVAALLAISAASAFETPVLVGLPGGVRVFVSAIYSALQGTAIPDYNAAAAECMIYLVFMMLVLVVYLRMTRVERRFAVVTGSGYTRSRRQFGAVRWVLFGIVVLYAFLAAFQLIAVTIFVSFVSFFSVTGDKIILQFSTVNYTDAFESGTVVSALVESLWIAFTVAAVVVVVATLLSYLSVRGKFRARRLLEIVGMLPIAIPPLVLSVALLLSVLTLPGFVALYHTPTPLLIADAVVFLPFGMRVLTSAILQISDALEEASRSAGASPTRTIGKIVVPLLRPALLSCFALVFAFSFRELGAIVLLVRPGQPMLPTETFQFFEVGQYGPVAVLNLVTVAALAAALLIIAAPMGRGPGTRRTQNAFFSR